MSYNPLKVSLENIIPLTEARDHFSQIVAEVQKDKLYVLTKGGKPAVAIIDVKYLETISGGEVQEKQIEEEIQKAPEKVGRPKMIEHKPLVTPPVPPTPITHPAEPPKPTPPTPTTPPAQKVEPPKPAAPPAPPKPETVNPPIKHEEVNKPVPTPYQLPNSTAQTPPPGAPKPAGTVIETSFDKPQTPPPPAPKPEPPKPSSPLATPTPNDPSGSSINVDGGNLDNNEEPHIDRTGQEDKVGPAQYDGDGSIDVKDNNDSDDMVID